MKEPKEGKELKELREGQPIPVPGGRMSVEERLEAWRRCSAVGRAASTSSRVRCGLDLGRGALRNERRAWPAPPARLMGWLVITAEGDETGRWAAERLALAGLESLVVVTDADLAGRPGTTAWGTTALRPAPDVGRWTGGR